MADFRRLPGATTDHWDWQTDAACRGLDTAMFFHPDSEQGEARRRRDSAAKALCARCPVQPQCRTHALTVQEPYGVWGGLSAADRDQLLHPNRTPSPSVPTTTDVRAPR